jgi:hypothetical protein
VKDPICTMLVLQRYYAHAVRPYVTWGFMHTPQRDAKVDAVDACPEKLCGCRSGRSDMESRVHGADCLVHMRCWPHSHELYMGEG